MGKEENKIETYLDEQVTEHLKGETRKYRSPMHNGVADRLCFLPNAKLYLVELKTEQGKEKGCQIRERKKMIKLGFKAIILHGKKEIDKWVKDIKGAYHG